MDEVVGGASSAIEAADGELVMTRQGSLVVLQGPQAVVEQFIAGEPMLRDRPEAKPSRAGALSALASLQALMPSAGGSSQQLFKLDSTALKHFNGGQLSQAANGQVNMVARRANGQVLKQGKLIPVDVNPTDALNLQMALVTLALTSAINEVADAVERVEDKLDRLADLLDADRVGSIVGAHRSLARRAELANADGTLAETDWHAIDDVGIQVEQQIEALRSFVRKRLRSAEDEGTGVADRRDALNDVSDLSEALGLLVVAQDSLFLFQQLRLARIRDTEPARLPAAVNEATALLADHQTEDEDLLMRVRQVVAGRANVKALEIHRFLTASELASTAAEVDTMLAWFATQRTLSYETIAEVEIPGIGDAVNELRNRGDAAVAGSRRIAGSLVHRVRDRSGERPALPEGDVTPALSDGTVDDGGTENGRTPDAGSRLRGRVADAGRRGAGRLRHRSSGKDDRHDNGENEATDA